MTMLTLAMLLFVGTHFLLSHPLRAPIAGAVGEKPFLGLYSLIAVAALGFVVVAYRGAATQVLWYAPDWLVVAGHVLMLLAAVLLAGSLITPNPALAGAEGLLKKIRGPRGVLRITRHPMMWSFALWALAHILHTGRLETILLAAGIGFLALAGAHMQDRKKAALIGERWSEYAAKTSYWLRPRWPGFLPVGAGIVLYLLMIALHPRLFGLNTRLGDLM